MVTPIHAARNFYFTNMATKIELANRITRITRIYYDVEAERDDSTHYVNGGLSSLREAKKVKKNLMGFIRGDRNEFKKCRILKTTVYKLVEEVS